MERIAFYDARYLPADAGGSRRVKTYPALVLAVLTACLIMTGITGCTRETSCESCIPGTEPPVVNLPPLADAGADQAISLPTAVASLDGSGSTDPDGNLETYRWTKISGPPSFQIDDASLVRPTLSGLTAGSYQVELTVTDSLGLSDKDTVQIMVKQESGLQSFQGVIFYWADPTGTVDFGTYNHSVPFPWLEWTNQGNYLNLVTIKLDTLTDFLAGVYCKNGCMPDCTSPPYAYYFGDKNIVVFKLPPGTYHWTAETTLNVFPLAPQNNPGVSPAFFHYFDTVHTTEGTATVTSTDQCVIPGIVF